MASTLIERVIGAVRLDAATYEEVEADPTAMTQAMIVVVVASIAAGIGASVSGAGGSVGVIRGTIGALIGWGAVVLCIGAPTFAQLTGRIPRHSFSVITWAPTMRRASRT